MDVIVKFLIPTQPFPTDQGGSQGTGQMAEFRRQHLRLKRFFQGLTQAFVFRHTAGEGDPIADVPGTRYTPPPGRGRKFPLPFCSQRGGISDHTPSQRNKGYLLPGNALPPSSHRGTGEPSPGDSSRSGGHREKSFLLSCFLIDHGFDLIGRDHRVLCFAESGRSKQTKQRKNEKENNWDGNGPGFHDNLLDDQNFPDRSDACPGEIQHGGLYVT